MMNFQAIDFRIRLPLGVRQLSWMLLGVLISSVLASCSTVTVSQYEATALTTYSWYVKYFADAQEKRWRIEEFAANSLLNVNGEKPEGAVLQDDGGLWWPVLPPKPSIDEVEQRAKPTEIPGTPELLKTIDYEITYDRGGQPVTLSANDQVYRQAARAYPYGKSLKLTLGAKETSVTHAEPL